MIEQKYLHILQHSLGLDKYGRGTQYRNHFVTGQGCDNYADCMALVEAGLMSHRAGNELSGGDDVFIVTEKGKEHVAFYSPKPPKVSKAKARYRRYLEWGDCFKNFIEFCKWDADPKHSWNGGIGC